ncbi:zinc finger protein OZF [Tribolium castaneum]|uniref:Zinc finger protein 879-like Protein n=1 Tax=Tribolium castaneum TaxID=7070 RepID=D6WL18_TRICA|nr:PREDICTED: zinc finger protein OZF [Tribolium castaneum]EFA04052.2 Zinc finger protein 879-like Protein [Tribolium castaneum]|eukprot:XP_008193680.1 PREDICTED: zinc finger protein OZF [Tribolium castaneum]
MNPFSEFEHVQIEEVCRICLTKKEQMSLIYETGLADMLLECASLQVTPDNGLFNFVCQQCQNEVSRWYLFKQQVVRSFEVGKWILERRNKKLENDELTNTIKDEVDIPPSVFDVNIAFNTLANNSKDVQSTFLVNESSNQIVNTPTDSQSKKKRTREDLVCKICHKQCLTTNSYNRHIRTHDNSRPFVCSKCDKAFKTTQVLSEHMKRHYDDRRHQCALCSKKFYSKASLNDHLRSHTGEKPFGCEVCGRAFGTKAILRQHLGIHTVREKKHQCNICGKFLLSAGSLDTHVRKHSGIKPFCCPGCDKSFFTKEAMQRHFDAIHDTDNNFLCNFCSKVCSTKVHLNNHLKKKHLGLGKPPNAVCTECGKQCGSAAELKVHVRVHTGERPYKCDICNKRFIAKGNLNSHKWRHTGRKPFLCNHCGKAFGEKSTLKVHERIHTGEQPYKCELCEKAYVQSSALRTHMKGHEKQ